MITVSMFKNHFQRDFPYLPIYDPSKIYFKGDVVYVEPNFYASLVDNNTAYITDDKSWSPYKDAVNSYLTDGDIQKAIYEANLAFNPELFSDMGKCEYTCNKNLVFMYLAAFYLVMDIQNAQSGLSSQAYNSFVASKSVGNVSESYGIPSWVSSNPMYSLYLSNGYGKKYLSYLIPRITGWFYCSQGGTTLS